MDAARTVQPRWSTNDWTPPGRTSTEEGYFTWEHRQLTLQAAVSGALLAAILIVACWEVRSFA